MIGVLLLLALPQVTVIRDVTVIDGPRSAPRLHQDVTIDGRRIASVSARRAPVARGARVIDGRGKYLLPGFIDMHAHVAFGPVSLRTVNGMPEMRLAYDHAASRATLRTLLAFGVTTVRNPGGPLAQAVALRDSLEHGLIEGPRVRTAGEAIDQFSAPGIAVAASTPEAVRAEVDRQAAAGVDYVKLYAGLTAPLVRAGVGEARARGVKAITHTMMTSWTDAANAGIHGIVHVVPGSPQLIRPDQRAGYFATMRGTQFMAQWFAFADLDSPEIREMTDALVRNGTWLDLTLVTFDRMFRGNQTEVIEGPDLRYAAPAMRESWKDMQLTLGWSDADFASAVAQWPRVEAFVRHLYAAGVRLTIGTDANNPWTPPGISFHRELELHVKAGIPPAEVLRMATLAGAQSLGMEGEIGTVEAGKRADLVLLDADPLADIRNTQRIGVVFRGGVPWRPAQLLDAPR